MRIIIEPIINKDFRNPDGHPVIDRHHHLICRLRDDDETGGSTIVTVNARQKQQLIICPTEGGLMLICIPFIELTGRQNAAPGLDAVGKHRPLPKRFHTGIDGKPASTLPLKAPGHGHNGRLRGAPNQDRRNIVWMNILNIMYSLYIVFKMLILFIMYMMYITIATHPLCGLLINAVSAAHDIITFLKEEVKLY